MAVTIAQLKAIIEADVTGLKQGLTTVKESFEKVKTVAKQFEREVTASINKAEKAEERLVIAVRKAEEALARKDLSAKRLKQAQEALKRAEDAYVKTAGENAAVNRRLEIAQQRVAIAATNVAIAQAKADSALKDVNRATSAKVAADNALISAQEKLALATKLATEALERQNLAAKQAKWTNLVTQIMTGSTALQTFNDRLRRAQSSLGSVGTGITTTFTLPVIMGGKAAFDAALQVETLRSMLINAMGSAEAAGEEFEKLKESSKLPGVTFQGILRGSAILQSVGMEAEKARKLMEVFGNEVSKVGGAAPEFEKTVTNIAQLFGQKALPGQELRQWATWLPQIRTALIDIYKTADTPTLAKAGITGKQVLEDLTNYFAKSGKAADTAKNQVKNLTNEFFLLAAEVGKDVLPMVLEFGKTLSSTLKEGIEWWKSLSEETRKHILQITALVAVAGPALIAMSGLVAIVRGLISVITGARLAIALIVIGIKVFQGTLTLVAVEAGTAWAIILGPITLVVAGIAAVGLAVYGLVKAFNALTSAGQKTREEINKDYDAFIKATKAKKDNLIASTNLMEEYDKLKAKTKLSKDETEKMQKILNLIADKTPEYITGYDNLGNAVGIVKNYYADATKELEKFNEQLRISTVVKTVSDNYEDLVQRLSDARDRLEELQTKGLKVTQKQALPFGGYDEYGNIVTEREIDVRVKSGEAYARALRTIRDEIAQTQRAIDTLKGQMTDMLKAGKSGFSVGSGAGSEAGKKSDLFGGIGKSADEAKKKVKKLKQEIIEPFDPFKDKGFERDGMIYSNVTVMGAQGYTFQEEQDAIKAYEKAIAKMSQTQAEAISPMLEYARGLGITAKQFEVLSFVAPEFAKVISDAFDIESKNKAIRVEGDKLIEFFTNLITKTKEAKEAREKLFASTTESWKREAAIGKDATEEQIIAYELVHGSLKSLDAMQKFFILGIIKSRDEIRKLRDDAEVLARSGPSLFHWIGKSLMDAIEKLKEIRKQKLADLFGDINTRILRLKDNFTAWAISMGFTLEEIKLLGEELKKAFELDQTLSLIEQFVDGTKEIFRDMFYDLTENGFKGLFRNIYQGFRELLLKMAIEYLTSQLYNLLLRSLGSVIPGLMGVASAVGGAGSSAGNAIGGSAGGAVLKGMALGGNVSARTPIIVGERGAEIFVPYTAGTIVSASNSAKIVHSLRNQFDNGAGNSLQNYGGSPVPGSIDNSSRSGDTYNITFNIANPIDAPQMRKAVPALINDARSEMERTAKRYN